MKVTSTIIGGVIVIAACLLLQYRSEGFQGDVPNDEEMQQKQMQMKMQQEAMPVQQEDTSMQMQMQPDGTMQMKPQMPLQQEAMPVQQEAVPLQQEDTSMQMQMQPDGTMQMQPDGTMQMQPQMQPQNNGVYPTLQERMVPITTDGPPPPPTDATAQSTQWLKTKPNPDTVGLSDVVMP